MSACATGLVMHFESEGAIIPGLTGESKSNDGVSTSQAVITVFAVRPGGPKAVGSCALDVSVSMAGGSLGGHSGGNFWASLVNGSAPGLSRTVGRVLLFAERRPQRDCKRVLIRGAPHVPAGIPIPVCTGCHAACLQSVFSLDLEEAVQQIVGEDLCGALRASATPGTRVTMLVLPVERILAALADCSCHGDIAFLGKAAAHLFECGSVPCAPLLFCFAVRSVAAAFRPWAALAFRACQRWDDGGNPGTVSLSSLRASLAAEGASGQIREEHWSFIRHWQTWTLPVKYRMGAERIDYIVFFSDLASTDVDGDAVFSDLLANIPPEPAPPTELLPTVCQTKREDEEENAENRPSVSMHIANALHLPRMRGKTPNTFVTFVWQQSEPHGSREDSAGVHGRDTLGQTDVIFRTTCPAWDHSSTLILPKYVGNSELAVYPKSFAAVRLALRVWHVETPGVDEHTFVGMASVSFSPLATGFREIDGYFHILGPGAPWSGAEPCGQIRLTISPSCTFFEREQIESGLPSSKAWRSESFGAPESNTLSVAVESTTAASSDFLRSSSEGQRASVLDPLVDLQYTALTSAHRTYVCSSGEGTANVGLALLPSNEPDSQVFAPAIETPLLCQLANGPEKVRISTQDEFVFAARESTASAEPENLQSRAWESAPVGAGTQEDLGGDLWFQMPFLQLDTANLPTLSELAQGHVRSMARKTTEDEAPEHLGTDGAPRQPNAALTSPRSFHEHNAVDIHQGSDEMLECGALEHSELPKLHDLAQEFAISPEAVEDPVEKPVGTDTSQVSDTWVGLSEMELRISSHLIQNEQVFSSQELSEAEQWDAICEHHKRNMAELDDIRQRLLPTHDICKDSHQEHVQGHEILDVNVEALRTSPASTSPQIMFGGPWASRPSSPEPKPHKSSHDEASQGESCVHSAGSSSAKRTIEHGTVVSTWSDDHEACDARGSELRGAGPLPPPTVLLPSERAAAAGKLPVEAPKPLPARMLTCEPASLECELLPNPAPDVASTPFTPAASNSPLRLCSQLAVVIPPLSASTPPVPSSSLQGCLPASTALGDVSEVPGSLSISSLGQVRRSGLLATLSAFEVPHSADENTEITVGKSWACLPRLSDAAVASATEGLLQARGQEFHRCSDLCVQSAEPRQTDQSHRLARQLFRQEYFEPPRGEESIITSCFAPGSGRRPSAIIATEKLQHARSVAATPHAEQRLKEASTTASLTSGPCREPPKLNSRWARLDVETQRIARIMRTSRDSDGSSTGSDA